MIVAITTVITVALMLLYLFDLRKNKLTTKMMVTIALFSAISFVLYLIQPIKYPQGGGISLLSMLPTMLLALLYGRTAGVTGGLIFGLLKLLNGAFVVHPAQFLLDYALATMALGLAGTFGREKKLHIIVGCLLAVVVSVAFNVASGCIFFGEYANGANVFVYSLVYNCTSAGLEGLLSVVVIAILPLKRFIKVTGAYNN